MAAVEIKLFVASFVLYRTVFFFVRGLHPTVLFNVNFPLTNKAR